MVIILCCLFLIIIGIIVLKAKFIKDSSGNSLCSGLLIVIPGVILFISLILIPIQRMSIYSEIKQFESVRRTISNARENGLFLNASTIENAAIQQKVIDSNKWLVNLKYWKTTTFSLWIPDEINNLVEIK